MARRAPDSEDDGGLDSLLDTMTNVVGILVLVLIVTQLSVKSVVEAVIENQVDQKEMDKVAENLVQKLQEEQDLERILVAPEDIDAEAQREELKRNQELLARLKADAEQAKRDKNEFAMKIQRDRDQAKKTQQVMQDTKAKRDELSGQITSSLERKASLQATLAKTPKRTAPADIKVSIPNPRPAPTGAKQVPILCVDNRVYPINVELFRKRAELRAKEILKRFRIAKDPVKGYDPGRFKPHWEKLRDQDAMFDVEYLIVANRHLRLRFSPRQGAGGTDRQLVNSRSKVRTQYLNQLDPTKYYARFYVLPDSFDVYLTARRLFNENRILSGWDPQSQDWKFTSHVPGGIELGPPIKREPRPPGKPQNLID